jgi:hypothetical protein
MKPRKKEKKEKERRKKLETQGNQQGEMVDKQPVIKTNA